MSIVDGTGLVTWEGGLFERNSDLLRRVQWAFGKIRADGGTIVLNEAGRPFGVPGDMQVRNAWQTASGISTVWFQWGRYIRGETPSAANPNSGALASEHTQGKAIDCDARDVYTVTLRAKYFAQVGMRQTISSESWHWAIRSDPTVTLSSSVASNLTPETPAPPKAEDMYLYVQKQGNLTTYILYIPGRNTYQTTQDATTANAWAVLVGHDAWPIRSEHVLQLDAIRRQFS